MWNGCMAIFVFLRRRRSGSCTFCKKYRKGRITILKYFSMYISLVFHCVSPCLSRNTPCWLETLQQLV